LSIPVPSNVIMQNASVILSVSAISKVPVLCQARVLLARLFLACSIKTPIYRLDPTKPHVFGELTGDGSVVCVRIPCGRSLSSPTLCSGTYRSLSGKDLWYPAEKWSSIHRRNDTVEIHIEQEFSTGIRNSHRVPLLRRSMCYSYLMRLMSMID